MKHLVPTCLIIPFLFLSSCSTTPKFSSQFNNPESVTPGSANLEPFFAQSGVPRNNINGLSFHVTNDTENLYILVDFVSLRLFQLAREFGFTLFIDGPDDVQRSFGVTYPTGLYYELRQFPGAQSGYLEEPNWENIPENRAMMETAERNMTRNGLITQRQRRRDNFQPAPIRLSQLQAQNLFIHLNEDGRNGRISFTIPMATRSTSQFSPDIKPGERISIGFEINPIRLYNLDVRGASPLTSGETTGRRTSPSQLEERRQEHLMKVMRRLGEPYENWVHVRLATPDN